MVKCKECKVRLEMILLIISNFLFFLVGGLLLAIGLWQPADIYRERTPLDKALDLRTGQAIFTAFGVLMLLIAFCGCLGAFKKCRRLLVFFVAFIIVLIVSEIVGIICAFAVNRDLDTKLAAEIVKDLHKNYNNQSSTINDAFMTEYKCCGWNGYQDFNFTYPVLPRPCCMNSSVKLNANSTCLVSMAPDVYGGCESFILDAIDSAGKKFIGVGIGVILLEIVVMSAASSLRRSTRCN